TDEPSHLRRLWWPYEKPKIHIVANLANEMKLYDLSMQIGQYLRHHREDLNITNKAMLKEYMINTYQIRAYCRYSIPVNDFQTPGKFLVHQIHTTGNKVWKNEGRRRDPVMVPASASTKDDRLNGQHPARVEMFFTLRSEEHTS